MKCYTFTRNLVAIPFLGTLAYLDYLYTFCIMPRCYMITTSVMKRLSDYIWITCNIIFMIIDTKFTKVLVLTWMTRVGY